MSKGNGPGALKKTDFDVAIDKLKSDLLNGINANLMKNQPPEASSSSSSSSGLIDQLECRLSSLEAKVFHLEEENKYLRSLVKEKEEEDVNTYAGAAAMAPAQVTQVRPITLGSRPKEAKPGEPCAHMYSAGAADWSTIDTQTESVVEEREPLH